MAKKYVILNFADYVARDSQSSRSTPITSLQDALGRRIHRKGGTYHIHNLADLLGDLRVEIYGEVNPHETSGLLDVGWMRSLAIEAAVHRREAWSAMLNDLRDADKIFFAAHGLKTDTDNVYCEVSMESIRCGDVEGVVTFLKMMLGMVDRKDPTITLIVCYAARSIHYDKHHVNDLDEHDIRSSLAFKIFCGLAADYPQIRLTARTGAVSGGDTPSTSVVSQTEEAILAEVEISQTIPDEEYLVGGAQYYFGVLVETFQDVGLTTDQERRLSNRISDWMNQGYDPNQLDAIFDEIDQVAESRYWFFMRALNAIGWLTHPAWSETYQNEIQTARNIVPMRRQLHELKVIAAQKKAKYGKFIYERKGNHVLVSRWVDDSLVQLGLMDPV